jgi:thioredoxin-related protein
MKGSILIVLLLLVFAFTGRIEESKKYNLIVFEGSDWCANCIRFEKNILDDSTFIQYLIQNNIHLLKIDFPQRKKISQEQKLTSEQMATKYNFDGSFPTIILTRSDTLFYEKIQYQNQSVDAIKAVIQHNLQVLQ